jgi:hypothetical protein
VENNNTSITRKLASIVRRFFSFFVALIFAGLLINAMRGFLTLMFFLIIWLYPEILEFFTYSERLVTNVGGILNLLILVVVFRPARRVYRFLANSVSEETRRPASTIGTGLSMLVVIIGTIAYYALPEMKY